MSHRRSPRPATNLDAVHFLSLGFRDYKAARHLLLHDFPFQGATLASTAVEKYIKCLVALKGSLVPLHFAELPKFRNELAVRGIDELDEVDPTFLQILSTAYRLRYYDTVRDAAPFGFFSLQLLAELDSLIATLESRFTTKTATGSEWKTDYRLAVESRDERVWHENFVLQDIDKKEFMERPSGGVAFSFLPDGQELTVEIKSGALSVERYEGKMQTLAGPITVSSTPANVGEATS